MHIRLVSQAKPVITTLLLTWAFLLAALPLRAATPPPEKLLGPDTVAVFAVPDWKKADQEMAASPAALFWKDDAIKPIREKFMAQFQKEVVVPLEKELGIKFDDYTGLARGQVTFALTLRTETDKKMPTPGFLMIMDAADQSADLEKALADLRQKWVDSGKLVRKVPIRDIEFNAIKVSSADIDKVFENVIPDSDAGFESLEPEREKTDTDAEFIIGQSGSLLLCAQNEADLEKLLVRQSGGDLRALADEPLFSRLRDQQFRNAFGYLWVNLKTLVTLAREGNPDASSSVESPEENPMVPSAGKVIAALGLDRMDTFGLSAVSQPHGSFVDGSLQAPGAIEKGLFNMLAFEAKESSPPAFVPADITSFVRCRLDMQKFWKTLEGTVTELLPQMAGVMALLIDNAGKDQDPNFDLRKNLIANLGDDIISYEKAPREQTLDALNSPPKIVLIQSPRAEELANAVKALVSLMPSDNTTVKEREFLGRTVHTLPLPPSQTADGKTIRNNLTYVASGSYVALSTEVGMVEEFLRGKPAKALRDEPGLQAAVERIGGFNTGFFAFENDRESMRTAFTVLKQEAGTLNNLVDSLLGDEENPDGATLKDWVDFSLLPPFEKVEKYFLFSVYTMKFDAQGFHLKTYTPNPPNYR